MTVALRSATSADVAPLIEFWARAGENRSRPTDRPELVARLIERDAESGASAGFERQADWARWIKSVQSGE